MAVQYRMMHPDEEEAVLDVWAAVHEGTERNQWQREFRSMATDRMSTFVAVTADPHVLATAHYWIRTIRGLEQQSDRVGLVSHVATLPTERRQGHASKLLELAIDAMLQEGCTWSLLFTSEEARSLYERYGWRTYPTVYRQGLLRPDRPLIVDGYSVRSYDAPAEPERWRPLAALYDAYNAQRPLTVVRTLADWDGYTGVRITDWMAGGATLLVASTDSKPDERCGYLLAHRSEHGFLVNELAVLPEQPGTLAALFSALTSDYAADQQVGGRVILPAEPAIEETLQAFFGPLETGASENLMMRPLSATANHDQVQAILAAPGAIFWSMDEV